jgi:hypothetical protein
VPVLSKGSPVADVRFRVHSWAVRWCMATDPFPRRSELCEEQRICSLAAYAVQNQLDIGHQRMHASRNR